MMEGYKVFKHDWTCRGLQYEVGKTFLKKLQASKFKFLAMNFLIGG